MPVKDCARFLFEFVRRPGVVGAVSPSSPGLALKMVEWIDWPQVHAVAEYGPGTGVFTGHILQRMQPQTRFFAVEINPRFVESMRAAYPGLAVYQESVKNVKSLCQKEQIDQLDAIVCGLPWAAFSEPMQNDFLDAMMTVLRPGGQFVTFAYLQGLLLPAGRRFGRKLRSYFSSVQRSKTAWRNLPPALVYRCRR